MSTSHREALNDHKDKQDFPESFNFLGRGGVRKKVWSGCQLCWLHHSFNALSLDTKYFFHYKVHFLTNEETVLNEIALKKCNF